jgi:hypothetical protein
MRVSCSVYVRGASGPMGDTVGTFTLECDEHESLVDLIHKVHMYVKANVVTSPFEHAVTELLQLELVVPRQPWRIGVAAKIEDCGDSKKYERVLQLLVPAARKRKGFANRNVDADTPLDKVLSCIMSAVGMPYAPDELGLRFMCTLPTQQEITLARGTMSVD